jgi:putative transposase
MKHKRYSSDLTNARWKKMAPLISATTSASPYPYGDMREVINGILYVLESGCPWQLLPHDLPPGEVVSWYFREWLKDGTWGHIYDVLHPKVRYKAMLRP